MMAASCINMLPLLLLAVLVVIPVPELFGFPKNGSIFFFIDLF